MEGDNDERRGVKMVERRVIMHDSPGGNAIMALKQVLRYAFARVDGKTMQVSFAPEGTFAKKAVAKTPGGRSVEVFVDGRMPDPKSIVLQDAHMFANGKTEYASFERSRRFSEAELAITSSGKRVELYMENRVQYFSDIHASFEKGSAGMLG